MKDVPMPEKAPVVDSRFWTCLLEIHTPVQNELQEIKEIYDGFIAEYDEADADPPDQRELLEAMEGALRDAWHLVQRSQGVEDRLRHFLPEEQSQLKTFLENIYDVLKRGIDVDEYRTLQSVYEGMQSELERRELERFLHIPALEDLDNPFAGLPAADLQTWPDIFAAVREEYALSDFWPMVNKLERQWGVLCEWERCQQERGLDYRVLEHLCQNVLKKEIEKAKKSQKAKKAEKAEKAKTLRTAMIEQAKQRATALLGQHLVFLSENPAGVQAFVWDRLTALGVENLPQTNPADISVSDQLKLCRKKCDWDHYKEAAWYQPAFWQGSSVKIEKTPTHCRVMPVEFEHLFRVKKPFLGLFRLYDISWQISDATVEGRFLHQKWQKTQLTLRDFETFEQVPWGRLEGRTELNCVVNQIVTHFKKAQDARPNKWFKWLFWERDAVLDKWQSHQLKLFADILNEQGEYLCFLKTQFLNWRDQLILHPDLPPSEAPLHALRARYQEFCVYVQQYRDLLSGSSDLEGVKVLLKLERTLQTFEKDLSPKETVTPIDMGSPETEEIKQVVLQKLSQGQVAGATELCLLCDGLILMERFERLEFSIRCKGLNDQILLVCRKLFSHEAFDAHAQEYLVQVAHYLYHLQVASDLDVFRELIKQNDPEGQGVFLSKLSHIVGVSRRDQLVELQAKRETIDAQLETLNDDKLLPRLDIDILALFDQVVLQKAYGAERSIRDLADALPEAGLIQSALIFLEADAVTHLYQKMEERAALLRQRDQMDYKIDKIAELDKTNFVAEVPVSCPYYETLFFVSSPVREPREPEEESYAKNLCQR